MNDLEVLIEEHKDRLYKLCMYLEKNKYHEEEISSKTAAKLSKKTSIAKPLIIVSVIYFVSLFVIVFALIGVGVSTELSEVTMDEVKVNGLRSGFSTVSIDSSTKEKINHTFHYTTEATIRKLKVYADEKPQIDIAITLESGVIELQILDEKQTVVFEKIYEGDIEQGGPKQMIDEVPLRVQEDQQYNVKFIYRKASNGKVEITG